MGCITNDYEQIKKLHIEYARNRGYNKSYCPSEVAKAFEPSAWREYMNLTRSVADSLISEGVLELMQNGHIIAGLATEAKGPIRLRIKNK